MLCLCACALPVMAQGPVLKRYELGRAHLQAGKDGLDYRGESPEELKECEDDEQWSHHPCHYTKAREYFSQVLALDTEIPSDTRTSALHHLGQMYRDGLGVVIDYAQAARYFRQVLEENDGIEPYALSELGWFYLHGLGVEKNPALAKQYLLQLERGILIGLWDNGLDHLAYLYQRGEIVRKDTQRAECYQQKHLDPISGSTDINACVPDNVVQRVFQAKNACYQEREPNRYSDTSACILQQVIKNQALNLDR